MRLRCGGRTCARPGHARLADGDQLLDGPNRQPLGDDALRQPLRLLRVLHGEQRARMPGGKHTGGDTSLHGRRQVQQADRVGDRGPGPPNALGQLLMGGAEVFQQLGVRRRLFQRVELFAVQVLQQGVPEHVVIGRRADERGNMGQAGDLAGAPASLPHDELEGPRRVLAHHDGLEQPDLADGRRQLQQGVLVEDASRLFGVRADRVDGQLAVADAEGGASSTVDENVRRAGSTGAVDGCGRNQRSESPAQPTASRAHAPPTFRPTRLAYRVQQSPVLLPGTRRLPVTRGRTSTRTGRTLAPRRFAHCGGPRCATRGR